MQRALGVLAKLTDQARFQAVFVENNAVAVILDILWRYKHEAGAGNMLSNACAVLVNAISNPATRGRGPGCVAAAAAIVSSFAQQRVDAGSAECAVVVHNALVVLSCVKDDAELGTVCAIMAVTAVAYTLSMQLAPFLEVACKALMNVSGLVTKCTHAGASSGSGSGSGSGSRSGSRSGSSSGSSSAVRVQASSDNGALEVDGCVEALLHVLRVCKSDMVLNAVMFTLTHIASRCDVLPADVGKKAFVAAGGVHIVFDIIRCFKSTIDAGASYLLTNACAALCAMASECADGPCLFERMGGDAADLLVGIFQRRSESDPKADELLVSVTGLLTALCWSVAGCDAFVASGGVRTVAGALEKLAAADGPHLSLLLFNICSLIVNLTRTPEGRAACVAAGTVERATDIVRRYKDAPGGARLAASALAAIRAVNRETETDVQAQALVCLQSRCGDLQRVAEVQAQVRAEVQAQVRAEAEVQAQVRAEAEVKNVGRRAKVARTCASCRAAAGPHVSLQACRGCKNAEVNASERCYCSVKCQKADWPAHKAICGGRAKSVK